LSSRRPPPTLDDWTQTLLQRAERKAIARHANEEIARERLRQQLAHGLALSYEVDLTASHGFAYLAQAVAPRLAHYIHQKKMHAATCRGVFLSLFVGDALYFIEAPVFFDVIRQAEGLDETAFAQKLRQWEKGP
jgi:hypothetical protein